jgi:hypothetical protein
MGPAVEFIETFFNEWLARPRIARPARASPQRDLVAGTRSTLHKIAMIGITSRFFCRSKRDAILDVLGKARRQGCRDQ